MNDEEPEFTLLNRVRLHKTDKSANGYYVWINDTPIVTKGPVHVERAENDKGFVTVTIPLAVLPDYLIED